MCEGGPPGGVCQHPDTIDDGYGAFESVTGGVVQADDFVPTVSADITHLGWWGTYVDTSNGLVTDCGPGAGDTFTVTYYEDAGGVPGAVHAGPLPVTNLTKCETGDLTMIGPSDYVEYQYAADHDPVAVEAGELPEGHGDAAGELLLEVALGLEALIDTFEVGLPLTRLLDAGDNGVGGEDAVLSLF